MKTKAFVSAILLSVAVSVIVTYYITSAAVAKQSIGFQKSDKPINIVPASNSARFCDLEFYRDTDLKLIRPVLFTDDKCESDQLADLKSNLSDSIRALQSRNQLSRAAVYFRDLEKMQWTSFNGQDNFHPGSMLKISIFLNILKQAEDNPALFTKLIQIDKNGGLEVKVEPQQKLIVGKSYSVMELLRAMILDSDNDATRLLSKLVDSKAYSKLFADLHIPEPAADDWDYKLSALDMSRFYRILYNASYLNRNASEFALKLLSETKFQEGLMKNLPSNAKAAHKFGERTSLEGLYQFHESGIVYVNNKAYLIVVMTEGTDVPKLIHSVADLSKVCYNYIQKGV